MAPGRPAEPLLGHEPAHERVAVRVQAGGGEADQHVAGGDIGRGSSVAALDGADGEPGQIVVARGIHARHLGRLAADEGASRLPAALGDAGDDRLRDLGLEPADAK